MNAPVAAPDSPVLLSRPDHREADRFTQDELNWVPALAPLPVEDLTERHYEGLTERARAQSPYFRLLVRDPEVLGARTRTDKDIFYNGDGGLPRAERELAATAVSRVNGCIFCASVHARFATRHSGRGEEIDRLLRDGVSVDLDPRWNAISAASERLTRTPSAFGAKDVRELREVGLSDDEVADLVFAAAFFNWANRLMLSLGGPEAPQEPGS
ncbi:MULTISPECIES: alkylhydroperoxidase domain protein [unclassified Aureimonas]|uniref:alkylhydroperoxidase domain protein n=1 Tax=unclassified Aureimonas TaxID=2615206 RepID=UPI0006FBE99D|nr:MULTISPECIES: alkylhydroperoxidase domain protein [unclassified Aureimonas]KQT68976.1 alkylhydroperoxidase [Aureimonas sp. Leaf460]KQT69206.1 alkylhydroperoxidase [Aureimonas sp. Leaf427]